MKESITIKISKFLTNDYVTQIARNQWRSEAPEWINRSQLYVFDELINDNDCFGVVAVDSNDEVIGRMHCVKNENKSFIDSQAETRSELKYMQLYKENHNLCTIAQELWVDFIKEVNGNDGKKQTKEQILDGFYKRVSIQGSRNNMHFEVMFLNRTPIGIAMFAIDLGTVYGLLEKGYGTVMGFYIHPNYRRMGCGRAFWEHIESVLRSDGASKFYICPDSVTGVPFWTSMGFEDSRLVDPDDKKAIFIKR